LTGVGRRSRHIMPRSLTLGNGHILVGFDHRGEVRDFYFPFVGLENHAGGRHVHRVGVFADGTLRWFDDPSWDITVDCSADTSAGMITAKNDTLGVIVRFTDIVYNEKNILVREVAVENTRNEKRTIKLFFGQQFQISESRRGDTAYYDPRKNVIVHYKGSRVFLVNTRRNDIGFDDYSIGLFGIEGKEGTFQDAHDGVLSKNPIEHGAVDSVIGITLDMAGGAIETLHYWITVGLSVKEAEDLNDYVLAKKPEHLLETTKNFWHAWVNKQNFSFHGLSEDAVNLFKKSLLIMRAHTDNNGSVIASGDSDMLQYGRDTYSYLWPRDGARIMNALDRAGDFNLAREFFKFCNRILTDGGYFMHKYRPDGSLGSSWHPWMYDGKAELPIQEDETALVLHALWEHYELTRDLEFIEYLYNPFIEKTANFLVGFMYPDTGLPYPSYDLWEEKYGITTFSCAAKYGALLSAEKFARLLGKRDDADRYKEAAVKVKQAIGMYLYNKDGKMFYKLIRQKNGSKEFERDATIDISSFYGIVKFGVFDIDDARVKNSIATLEKTLLTLSPVGGVPRYEGDDYYRERGTPPNPWFITTLWLAQYYIKAARTEKDLARVHEIFAWTVAHATRSGVLSEQVHSMSGAQISAAPLAWSHAEYVATVIDYLEKLEDFGICKACNPVGKHLRV